MDRPNEPELTIDLLVKSTDNEAIRDIMRVEAEYREELKKLEDIQQQRAGNLYHLKREHTVSKEFEAQEKEAREKAFSDLKQQYREKAEKTFQKYHPDIPLDSSKTADEPFKSVSDDQKKKEHTYEKADRFIKGFNDGYVMEKYDPKLAKICRDTMKGISEKESYADGFRHGNTQYDLEKSRLTLEQFRENKKDMDIIPDRNKDRDKDIDIPL